MKINIESGDYASELAAREEVFLPIAAGAAA